MYVESLKDERKTFTIAFIGFYSLERIVTLISFLLQQTLSKAYLTASILAFPFYLEGTIYLKAYFQNYKSYEPGLIFNTFNLIYLCAPLHVLMIIQATQFPVAACTIIPAIIGFISITSSAILIEASILFGNDFFDMKFNWDKFNVHLPEIRISALQFFSYFSLVYLNGTQVDGFFTQYITFFVVVLIISFARIFKKFEKGNSKVYLITFGMGVLLKQLMHVNFDPRSLQPYETYPPPFRNFGKFFFDEMIQFSLCLKIYLLIILIVRILDCDLEVGQTISMIAALLIGLISFRIQASRLFEYYFRPDVIEVFSYKQLQSMYNGYQSKSLKSKKKGKWSKIKLIYSRFYWLEKIPNEFLLEVLMSGFMSAELEFNESMKRKFQQESASEEEKNKFRIEITDVIMGESYVKAIQSYLPLARISCIYSRCEIINVSYLINAFIEKNILIKFDTNRIRGNRFYKEELLLFNQYLKRIEFHLRTFQVFSLMIAPYQYVNPQILFYDLLEDAKLPLFE